MNAGAKVPDRTRASWPGEEAVWTVQRVCHRLAPQHPLIVPETSANESGDADRRIIPEQGIREENVCWSP